MKPRRSHSTELAAAVLCFGLSAAASAGELCVTCRGPDAVYRCAFKGSSETSAPQLACIGELARQGGHKSCSLARNRQGPCEGAIREVAVVGGDETPAPQPKSAGETATETTAPPAAVETYEPAPELKPPADHADDAVPARPKAKPEPKAADAEQPAKPPRTVQEMVEKSAEGAGKSIEGAGDAVSGAAKSAGEAAEKTGSAIGNAAKKTWKCLASLFGDC